jgi:regulator of sirC expression with transglutaminase-like and TPR domain
MPDATKNRGALASFSAIVGVESEDSSIDLAAGALAIARMEYPLLDVPYYVSRLESLAKRVRSRMRSIPTPREMVALLGRVLCDEEGLRGNRDDYYDPRNSFLNDVLDRKLGIPITLSVIYMDVSRRVGFPVAGTGMPGHFLLKHYDVMSGEIVIDPFNRGRIVGNVECQQWLNEIYSGQVGLRAEFLQAVSNRDILTRMLNNLRQIYFTKQNLTKGLAVMDYLLAVPPTDLDLLRERGLVRLNLEQYLGAAQDLGAYLKARPDAEDSGDVEETLEMLRQHLARLN